LLIYNAAAALYLAYVGWSGPWGGALLWPAVALHCVLTVLLILASRGGKASQA
jgi:hypothetical protein